MGKQSMPTTSSTMAKAMTLNALTFPRPPRRVKRSVRRGCGVAAGRLFILPHIVAGAGVALLLVGMLMILVVGRPADAVVVERQILRGEDGDTWDIRYRYQVGGGRVYIDHAQVNREEYSRLAPGAIVKIKSLHVMGLGTSVLVEPMRQTLRTLGFLTVFATFWNGVLSVFVWMLYVVPRRQVWLARHGEPVMGQITAKKTHTSDESTTYSLLYVYRVPGMTEDLKGKQRVNGPAFGAATQGQTTLVLYAPTKPGRSLLYEFSDYVIEDD
jgi:hypothetical protein